MTNFLQLYSKLTDEICRSIEIPIANRFLQHGYGGVLGGANGESVVPETSYIYDIGCN